MDRSGASLLSISQDPLPSEAFSGGSKMEGQGEGSDNSSDEQVVLISGCSEGGIGYSLAKAFAAEGCHVVATSRSLGSMRSLEGDPRFFLQEMDVVSEETVRKVVDNAIAKFGRIDVLVNNAGVHCVAPLSEVPISTVENVFDTNVFGSLRLIQAVVPHMASRRKGKIVNMGSVTALASAPWAGVYSASKAALHALSDTLRVELRSHGINVINVAPGAIQSNLGNTSLSIYNRMPEWKLYKGFEESMRQRTTMSQGNKAMPSEKFADKTVAIVLKKNPPVWFSCGRYSTIFAILYHLPLAFRDFLFRKIFKC